MNWKHIRLFASDFKYLDEYAALDVSAVENSMGVKEGAVESDRGKSRLGGIETPQDKLHIVRHRQFQQHPWLKFLLLPDKNPTE